MRYLGPLTLIAFAASVQAARASTSMDVGSVTATAEYSGKYIFEHQGGVYAGPTRHYGLEYSLDGFSIGIDQYEADNYLERDYTGTFDHACFGTLSCTLTAAYWDTPAEGIWDFSAELSGGKSLKWNLTVEHQDGETYQTNVISGDLSKTVKLSQHLSLSGTLGVGYDTGMERTSGYGKIELDLSLPAGFTVFAGAKGFDILDEPTPMPGDDHPHSAFTGLIGLRKTF